MVSFCVLPSTQLALQKGLIIMKKVKNELPIKVYETKHGTRYMFSFYAGQNTDKNYSRTIQKRGFKDYDSAVAAYLDTKKALESGQLKPRSKRYTFKDIYDQWFSQHKQSIKPSSAYATQLLFNNHILPELGSRYIDKITPAICQLAVNRWADKRPKSYKALSIQASQVFDYAYRLELIDNNPFKRVIVPRLKQQTTKDNYYTKQELNQFLECCKEQCDLKYYAAFRLLAYSGMRKGELRALTWNDVDFNKNTIAINKTATIDETGKTVIQLPKTHNSTRVISMDQQTMAILREWQIKQRKDLLRLGYNAMNGRQIVFNGKNNKPLSHVTLNDKFKNVQVKNGLKVISIHGLRHTHCSLLLAAGVPVNDVKDRLGHANIQTTLNIYAHVTKQQRKDTADLFSQFMQA